MTARTIRRMQIEFEGKLNNLFPTIPKSTISSYVHLHPSLSLVDFLAHFLTIAEPKSNNIDISTAMSLAQARQILRQQEKMVLQSSDSKDNLITSRTEEKGRNQEALVLFEIPNYDLEFQNRISVSLSRLRREKKRMNFLNDDFLDKIASYYSHELMIGNSSIDSNDWQKWTDAHPEKLTDILFYANFVLSTADPTGSVIQILTKEPACQTFIKTSNKYCGIGVSISKMGTVFFCIISSNIQ